MKVVAINGSPRKNSNTAILIDTVFEELNAQDIQTERIDIGQTPVRGCIACMKCFENKDGQCAIRNDALNECLEKMRDADGILLGSPVYFAGASGQIKSFMDRAAFVGCANRGMFAHKVGASVVAVRRAGAVHTFNSLNHYFTILQMLVVGSSYWNMGFGLEPGGVCGDEEGLATMRNLGRNMAWVLTSLKTSGIEPPQTL